MSVIDFLFLVNQAVLIRKKTENKRGIMEVMDIAYIGRKASNVCAILVDNPVGPNGSTTTAFVENQTFLGTNFVGPRLDFTILTGGFPVASLCLPVDVTAI